MKLVLYNALIKPYILYGIELWSNANKTHLKNINIWHRKAIRMVFNLDKFHPTADICKSNNILTINQLRYLQMIKLGFDIKDGVVSLSITNKFHFEPESSRRAGCMIEQNASNAIKRLPKFNIIRQWNLFHQEDKNIGSYSKFKRFALKEFLI